MCMDTEELARRSVIYASLADLMVASVIEELSPKDQRSKLLRGKLSKRPRSPQFQQDLWQHPTFSFYAGTAYLRTLASSLRSWVLWGRLHSRVLTSQALTLKSFRTGIGPSGKMTEWLAHLWHLSRNPKRQARKWHHPPGRTSPRPLSMTVWVLLQPPLCRELGHRISPLVLAPAGEPAIDPTQSNARILTRLLKPDSVDGV